MDTQKVAPPTAVAQVEAVLDAPEIAQMIRSLEDLRWTGRPGYPVRAMVGMCFVKSIYTLNTWSRTARLVAEHEGLQQALGAAPSQWACYRFTRTLREHSEALAECLNEVLESLRGRLAEMGQSIAIDGSDLPA